MTFHTPAETSVAANLHDGDEVASILRESGWLAAQGECDGDGVLRAWMARAAELLGPHAADRRGLRELLALIFAYDAAQLLQDVGNQGVLARTGAREVIRELANRILDGGEIDSDRFKGLIGGLKLAVPYRSRAVFQ